MDYGEVMDGALNFDPCARRSSCIDISIVDDEVLENSETFFISLERSSTLSDRITLAPVDGTVEIIDNDGMCGYCGQPSIMSHYAKLTISHAYYIPQRL